MMRREASQVLDREIRAAVQWHTDRLNETAQRIAEVTASLEHPYKVARVRRFAALLRQSRVSGT